MKTVLPAAVQHVCGRLDAFWLSTLLCIANVFWQNDPILTGAARYPLGSVMQLLFAQNWSQGKNGPVSSNYSF